MRHARFDHLLAGTALVAALALTATSSGASAEGRPRSAAIPVPAASADLPTPSVKDITPDKSADQPAKTANATGDITNAVSGSNEIGLDHLVQESRTL